MKIMFSCVAAGALSMFVLAVPLAASASSASTDFTVGGRTKVALASSFLEALNDLDITPAAIGPGSIEKKKGTTYAIFPITTGQLDGAYHGEIDHSGGLSLTLDSNTLALTSFAIDLYSNGSPVLTGLASVNGMFLGRVPLFDLSLVSASIGGKEEVLSVKNVALTLDSAAVGALNTYLHTNLPHNAKIEVGTADVRALLEEARY